MGLFFAHFRMPNKNSNFATYLRVEINWGGGIGPFFAHFRTLNKNLLEIALAASLYSALELQNIEFTNNHFGHLTSKGNLFIEF